MLYHAGIGPGAGFVGVDVFFVISGYLITALLYKEWATTGKISLLGFYARRVRRIFPALIVVVLGTVAASTILLSPFGEQLKVTQSASASLLFVANFYFQATSGGYFDGNSGLLPLLHLWSLAVEEQFYLLWPIALIVLLRRPKSLLPALLMLSIASLALAEFLIRNDPSAAFYQMPARFWELAVGGLIALRPAGQLPDGRPAVLVGLIAVVVGAAIPALHFPGVGALPAVAGAALLLHGVHGSTRLGLAGACLRSRPMVFVGVISYSLYLWHWPLLAVDRATRIGPSPLPVRLMLVGGSLVLAWLSYRFVEKPFRRPDWTAPDSRLVAAGLMASISLATCLTVLGGALSQTHALVRSATLAERTSEDMPPNTNHCHYPGLEPLAAFPKPNCNSVANRPVRVVIWGDSFALAWQPFAWALAQRDGVAAIDYARSSCPPVLGYMILARTSKPGELCQGFNALVSEKIKGVDTLILVADWQNYFGSSENPAYGFQKQLAATIAQVLPNVGRIILLGPTPEIRDSAPRCIERSELAACAIDRRSFNAAADASRKLLQSLAATSTKIEYVELANFFCGADTCPVLKDGYSLYTDTKHVSSTAARHFAVQYLETVRNRINRRDRRSN